MKIEKTVLYLLVCLGIAAGGQSTEPAAEIEAETTASLDDFALIEREVYFGNPERTQGRISPDGKMMSFIAPLDGVMNLWVAPLGDFDAAKPLTDDKLRGIGSHQRVCLRVRFGNSKISMLRSTA